MVEECSVQQKNATSKKLGSRAVLEFYKMLVKGIEPPAYALRVRLISAIVPKPRRSL